MEDLKTQYTESMKVSKETFEQIKSDFQTLFEDMDMPDRATFWELAERNKTSLVWQFWNKIKDDKTAEMLPESEPGKARVFMPDPDFELYPDGTNDDTLETALIRAANNIIINHKRS